MPAPENLTMTASGGRIPRLTATALAAAALCVCVAAVPAGAAKKKPKTFTVKARSGTMTLTFTPAAWAALNSSTGGSVGENAAALAPATLTAPGVVSFPIARGSLNSRTGTGSVSATGALNIESHLSFAGLFTTSSNATANNPIASFGAASNVTFSSPNFIPTKGLSLFRLNTFHMKVAGGRHSVSLTKIPAKLTTAGARFFSVGFSAGQQIGAITVQIKG